MKDFMEQLVNLVAVIACAVCICFFVFSVQQCTINDSNNAAKQAVSAQHTDTYQKVPVQ